MNRNMKEMGFRRYSTRLFLEGFVVVVSILIAFLLDAWWQNRQSENELELELAGVRAELEFNRSLVLREIQSLNRISSAGSTVIEMMYAAKDSPSVQISDSMAWLVTLLSPTMDASFGAVEALIGSGRLGEIENPALRSGLGGLKNVFEDAVEDELLARQIQIEQQVPMIFDRIDLAPLIRIDAEIFGAGASVTEEVQSYVNVDYPNDTEVRNVMQHRMSWLVSAGFEMDRLLEHLDDLINMIPPARE